VRGYDAVHCAAAEQLSDEQVVAASGDRRLLDVWAALGVATFDTNHPVVVLAVRRAAITVAVFAQEAGDDSSGYLGAVGQEMIVAYARTDWPTTGIIASAYWQGSRRSRRRGGWPRGWVLGGRSPRRGCCVRAMCQRWRGYSVPWRRRGFVAPRTCRGYTSRGLHEPWCLALLRSAGAISRVRRGWVTLMSSPGLGSICSGGVAGRG
jgi:hypothetical protein